MPTMVETRKVWAKPGATAWLNAAIACSQEEERSALYRTLSVEFFPAGIQFVGCDGHMLFRTWAPFSDCGELPTRMPEWEDLPEDQVVVLDRDKFALGFMRTLLGAIGDSAGLELEFSIDPIERDPDDETTAEPPLGEELEVYVLTLHALGQRLSCRLYEGPYPVWRALKLGIDAAERVDGMMIGVKLFAAVGKLRGVNGIELEFRGEDKAVMFRAGPEDDPTLTGVLMPMRRKEKSEPEKPEPGDEQLEHE